MKTDFRLTSRSFNHKAEAKRFREGGRTPQKTTMMDRIVLRQYPKQAVQRVRMGPVARATVS